MAGVPVGVTICEDMWFAGGPMVDQAEAGARLMVNLNASPYSRGRREQRLAVLAARVEETGCPIVYVNQVGGQDELVFDGASVVIDRNGDLVASAHQFEEEILVVDVQVELEVDRPDHCASAEQARSPRWWSAPPPVRRPPPGSVRSRPYSTPMPRSTGPWCSALATTWPRTVSPTR